MRTTHTIVLRGEARWLPADAVYLTGEGDLVVHPTGEPDLVLPGGVRLSDFWWWLDGHRVTLTYNIWTDGEWLSGKYTGIVRGYVHDKATKRADGSYMFRPEAYFNVSESPGSMIDHIWDQISGPVRGTLTFEL
jgi:hypothetical protein